LESEYPLKVKSSPIDDRDDVVSAQATILLRKRTTQTRTLPERFSIFELLGSEGFSIPGALIFQKYYHVRLSFIGDRAQVGLLLLP